MNVDNATAAPSVLLFFDRERYLFNAGEGIQRHFFEHKQRLKKVIAAGDALADRPYQSTGPFDSFVARILFKLPVWFHGLCPASSTPGS